MMMPNAEDRGIVLECDAHGVVLQVVRNDFGASIRVRAGSQLIDLVDASASEKIALFLEEVRAREAAYNWEITAPIEGTLVPLHFAGARLETSFLIIAAGSSDSLASLNSAELMRINNEQTNILRATAKALSAAARPSLGRDDPSYEELGRLNNEMVNLQRELAKKNAELQRYYYAAEEEQRVASHLMNQIVRADLLRDPCLRCWIAPAHKLSGDLIAAARTPNGVLQVLLADGTGHGLAASLNVLPTVEPFYAMTAKGLGASAIAREINAKITRWLPVGRFVAAALLTYDPREGRIEVWCGGIPAPFLLDASGRMVCEFPSAHLALGVLSEQEFDARTQVLHFEGPGQLIACSDGATEAQDANGEQFGRERLVVTLCDAPPAERLDCLKRALSSHAGGRPATDDISVAIIDCVRGSARPSGKTAGTERTVGSERAR